MAERRTVEGESVGGLAPKKPSRKGFKVHRAIDLTREGIYRIVGLEGKKPTNAIQTYLVPVKLAEIPVESKTGAESVPTQEMKKVELLAKKIFGTKKLAGEWLHDPNPATFAISPIALLEREGGTDMVLELLHQIEYGFLA